LIAATPSARRPQFPFLHAQAAMDAVFSLPVAFFDQPLIGVDHGAPAMVTQMLSEPLPDFSKFLFPLPLSRFSHIGTTSMKFTPLTKKIWHSVFVCGSCLAAIIACPQSRPASRTPPPFFSPAA